MTILEKLNLTDKTRAAMLASPEGRLRGKMLEGIDLQVAAAKANLNGETFIRRVVRSSWLKISGSTVGRDYTYDTHWRNNGNHLVRSIYYDTTALLLISGSKVRVLVRPPSTVVTAKTLVFCGFH